MAVEATPSFLYLPGLLAGGSRIELSPADSRYVARVCRARVGELVEATDGRGALAVLRLTGLRDRVVAEIVSARREERRRRAWVLCGSPEGERADWLVEKLAELGVERFLPVDFARASWKRARARRSRWTRLAIAGLRQSKRLHLMSVEEQVSLEHAMGELPAEAARWLADESGAGAFPAAGTSSKLAIGLIGPSSGLTEAERAVALRAGFQPLRLSDARLRAETAALAWAAWWSGGVGR